MSESSDPRSGVGGGGAFLSVDTFFFLSGLLTTFTLLKRMRKSSKTSFPAGKFILLRFLRLTPLYAYILFFYTYLVPYFASGPVWYRMLDDTALCRKHWWTNLLYINEFYPASFHSTCTATSTSFWAIFVTVPSSTPPRTRRVL